MDRFQIHLRLPMGLHDELRARASSQGTSMNTFLASLIAGSIGWTLKPEVSPGAVQNLPKTRTPLLGNFGEETPELFIERSKWVFAKTMPHAPHEYTLKDPDSRAPAMSEEAFVWFVEHIREHGYTEKFGGRSYTYLDLGEWRYWTMGWPPEQTTLINRARLDPES